MKDPNRRKFLKETAAFLAALPFVSFFGREKKKEMHATKESYTKGRHYKKLAG